MTRTAELNISSPLRVTQKASLLGACGKFALPAHTPLMRSRWTVFKSRLRSLLSYIVQKRVIIQCVLHTSRHIWQNKHKRMCKQGPAGFLSFSLWLNITQIPGTGCY